MATAKTEIGALERALLASDSFVRQTAQLLSGVEPASVLRFGVVVILLCGLGWFWSGERYEHLADEAYRSELQQTQRRVSRIAENMASALNRLNGVAATVAADEATRQLLQRNTAGGDYDASAINAFLHATAGNLDANTIWVIDAAGNCIAASNAGSAESFVGINYRERYYFKRAEAGQPGREYAIGKVTGVAGLYFSQPVIEHGRFLGAVAVKSKIDNFSGLLARDNAMLVDALGVVVLAADRALEYRSLPGAAAQKVSAAALVSRYQRSDLTPLALAPYGDARYPALARIDGAATPSLVVAAPLTDGAFTIYAMPAFTELQSLAAVRLMGFALITIVSVLVALLGAVILLAYHSAQRERMAAAAEHAARLELHDRMQEEQHLAKGILEGAVMGPNVHPPALRSDLTPATTFNGDLLLSAYAPAGDLYVMLGDFTGHGLAAALGALPVAEIFRAMTHKWFAPAPMLDEINRKLRRILPTGRFLCATLVRVERALNRLTVINCGMPEGWLVRNGVLAAAFPSRALPVGICADGGYAAAEMTVQTARGDRLLLASDGVTEAVNAAGEMFGAARLEQAIRDGLAAGAPLDEITGALERFCEGIAPLDDTTLADIHLLDTLFAADTPSNAALAA